MADYEAPDPAYTDSLPRDRFTSLDPNIFLRELIGAASMCWENPAGAGTFDDREAIDLANDASAHLARMIRDSPDVPTWATRQ